MELSIQGYYCFCLFHFSISSYFSHISFKRQFSPCSLHLLFPSGQETTTFASTNNDVLHARFRCSHFANPNFLADKSWSEQAQILIWLFSMILTVRVIFYLPQTSLFLALGWFQLLEFLCSCHPMLEPPLHFCLNTFNRTLNFLQLGNIFPQHPSRSASFYA